MSSRASGWWRGSASTPDPRCAGSGIKGSAIKGFGPKRAQFPFVDIASGQRWLLDLGDSRLPLWVFDEGRRVPDTRLRDYLALSPLIWNVVIMAFMVFTRPLFHGDAQMYVNSPSLGINSVSLGDVSLNGLALGTWQTLAFQIPAATASTPRRSATTR